MCELIMHKNIGLNYTIYLYYVAYHPFQSLFNALREQANLGGKMFAFEPLLIKCLNILGGI